MRRGTAARTVRGGKAVVVSRLWKGQFPGLQVNPGAVDAGRERLQPIAIIQTWLKVRVPPDCKGSTL